MPFYSLAQTKAAIVRHVFETARRPIKRSEEYPLEECLSTPYVHGTGDEGRSRAYSIAFAYKANTVPRGAFGRPDIVSKTRNGDVWVELKQATLLTILGQLDEERGRFVIRVWYHWPRFEKSERHKHGSYYVGDNLGLHYRLCDAGSSGGGSGAGSGAGSDAGSGAGSWRGELHAGSEGYGDSCNVCHGGGIARPKNDGSEVHTG